jgi:outer membrane protein OmpA-like peptidoglycan-associated protein
VTPSVVAGVHQSVPDTEAPQAVGLHAAAEIAIRERLSIEAGLGADPGEPFYAGWAGGRARIVGGLSFALGAGVAGAGPGPAGTAALGFDVDFSDAWGVRLETRGWAGPDVAALQLGVSARWRRPERELIAEPVPVAIPDVAPPAGEEPLVWLAHPVCAWVPESEVARWEGVASASDLFASRPGPPQGAFVVVASRSDRVTVDEAALAVAEDGIAVVNAPEGVHVAKIVGGGREETVEAAVAGGFLTWVRASDPAERLVRFAGGSSVVTAASKAELAEIARLAGDWRFRVTGSYSPEGDPEGNKRLAEARAEAVRQALIDAGLPRDRVIVTAPARPPEGALPEDQRVARVIPW